MIDVKPSIPIVSFNKGELLMERSTPYIRNRSELEEYFSQDRLKCMICDQSFIVLPHHLRHKHGVSPDDYKVQFGIPFKYGLAGKKFRDRSSKRFYDMQRVGKMPRGASPETLARMTYMTVKRHAKVSLLQEENLQKVLKLHNKSEVWKAEDFEELIRRISSGRTVKEVTSDPDMPSRKCLYKYLNGNPEKKKKFNALWETLPFDVQVRANKTGKAFLKKIVELRKKRLAWTDISAIMQVKVSTLRNAWHYRARNL